MGVAFLTQHGSKGRRREVKLFQMRDERVRFALKTEP
jgi:hypothetical protein